MDDKVEVAIKRPETIPETERETLERTLAEELYYQSGGRRLSGLSGYAAGWIAAKARFESGQ